MMYRCLLLLLIAVRMLIASNQAVAEGDLLPKGIGAIQVGYRGFLPQTHNYNNDGKRVPLGDPLSSQFNGPSLLQGKGGPDLKRLVQELQKFDSFSQSADSLVNKIDLGKLEGDVQGKVDAKFFGLAYGLSRRINLFIGAPWVEAEVNTELRFTGTNNAQEIKDRLGAVAFDELKVGLDRASAINIGQIQQSIEASGYAPLDHWYYKGFGDTMLGANTGDTMRLNRRTDLHYLLTSTLHLPTGYSDNPDILTDVAVGTGYYGLENKFAPRLELFNRWSLGGWAAYKYNFATTASRRVPESDESLVDASRKFDVDYTPGADYQAGVETRFRYQSLITSYRLGYKEHALDRYDGPVEGNYEQLAMGSHMRQTFHEISGGLDTTRAYQQKKFAIPMLINASAHLPIKAYNSTDERYFELSFTTFFSTPAAKSTTKNSSNRELTKTKSSRQTSRAH